MSLPQPSAALTALRRFARPAPAAERCDLCATPIAEPHEHLLEPKSRRLMCACPACSVLFPPEGQGAYRRVVRCCVPLPGVALDDARWDALGIPVRLVFVIASVVHGRVFALYPNAAGLTETIVANDAWEAFVRAYPELTELEPDVQGLWIDALSGDCRCYRASIDECHRLAGQLRGHHTYGVRSALEVAAHD